ncbi:hypothetical protein N7466_009614 [Penicillium verhagenii]|uniref:uncharacterized protein n=1 Tax=Penicillium verhagenii TaxID=1562060 RepID=UPI0025453628|nr:uncharacterized protein N7466_009614 [Penicillium verhagenii]KAJ5921288.1 hypothetical protein N7466_009614 [Penicillium verhagenii]
MLANPILEGDDSSGTFITEEGYCWSRTYTNDSFNEDISYGTIASPEKSWKDKERVSEEPPTTLGVMGSAGRSGSNDSTAGKGSLSSSSTLLTSHLSRKPEEVSLDSQEYLIRNSLQKLILVRHHGFSSSCKEVW